MIRNEINSGWSLPIFRLVGISDIHLKLFVSLEIVGWLFVKFVKANQRRLARLVWLAVNNVCTPVPSAGRAGRSTWTSFSFVLISPAFFLIQLTHYNTVVAILSYALKCRRLCIVCCLHSIHPISNDPTSRL